MRTASPLAVAAALSFTTFAAAPTFAEVLHRDPARDPNIGINIWNVHAQPAGVSAWEQQIDRMHSMGFGAVTILPQSFVNLQTGAVTPTDPTPSPRFGGMTDAELTAAVTRAKSYGMLVTVSPTVEAADRQIFRGHISFNDVPDKPINGVDTPENENRFWSSYTQHITHVAQIAQQAGADRLNIGAEMQALDTDPRNAARWGQLIDAADAQFHRQLGYSTVHWTFDSQPTRDMIYSNPKIDYVSLSAYFDLATAAQAANSSNPQFIEQVRANFTTALQSRVIPFGRAMGKPVVLNEIGVTPYDGGSVQPWDWTIGDTAAYDELEARNAIEGIFRALSNTNDDISAANLWIWGWQGGFPGERFGINDNLIDLPNTPFDETKMQATADFVRTYLVPVPEPATGAAMLSGILLIATRRRAVAH